MTENTLFTPLSAAVGGGLIGLGAVVLMLTLGRVAGISGIYANAIRGHQGMWGWSLAFLLGLVGAAAVGYFFILDEPFVSRQGFPTWLLLVGGLLVGFGTSLGSGCTSGHGVCGLARLSPRSLAATVVFLLVGLLTASILGPVLMP